MIFLWGHILSIFIQDRQHSFIAPPWKFIPEMNQSWISGTNVSYVSHRVLNKLTSRRIRPRRSTLSRRTPYPLIDLSPYHPGPSTLSLSTLVYALYSGMYHACFTEKNLEVYDKCLLTRRAYFSLQKNDKIQFSIVHPKRKGSHPLFVGDQQEECSTTWHKLDATLEYNVQVEMLWPQYI